MSATNVCSRVFCKLSSVLSNGSYVQTLYRHPHRSIAGSCVRRMETNAEEAKADDSTDKKIEELEAKYKQEKEKLEADLTDLKDKYTRSLAEAQNVRNRMQKQIDDAKLFGIQGFCKDLLEVADILGKATESTPQDQLTQNQPLKDLFDGLTMTESQLQKVFTKHGLVQINPPEGEKFDPNYHEALFQQPRGSDDKTEGTIATVTKIGYQLHSRTVRPALVGVYS